MKRSRQFLFQMLTTAIFAIMLSSTANATSYTASVSGAFSSTATWGGGPVPPTTISGSDNISINPGVTVTMDQDLTIANATATLSVFGRIAPAASAHYIIMTSGILAGTGSISVDSMAIGGTSINLSFAGYDTVQKFTSLGFNVIANANVYVAKKLYLANGLLGLNSGSISVATNATVVINGGTFSVSGSGMFNPMNNTYNVQYLGGSATAGAELSGSNVGKVDVNVGGAAAITLAGNTTLKDTLTLTSGELILNNFNLNFAGNGNFSASGTGTIYSTAGSNISFNSNNSFASGLRFSANGNAVNNLTVNMGSSSVNASLASGLIVSGQLALQMGKLSTTGTLTIAQTASVAGGTANSYVITSGSGSLGIYVATGDSAVFHVGTNATNYTPAVVVANSTSASGIVNVTVNPSVYLNGTTGTVLSTSESVVNATWFISSTATTGINYNLWLMWNAGMEVNSFNRAQAYIAHYTAGAWDKVAVSAAVSLSGMYAISRNNITSLSPFAVADANASMTNVPLVAQDKGITFYPNPATTSVSFKSPVKIDRIDIYNIMGRMIQSTTVTNNSISIDGLPSGLYNAHLYGKEFSSVQKFVKE
jgi:pectate lyase